VRIIIAIRNRAERLGMRVERWWELIQFRRARATIISQIGSLEGKPRRISKEEMWTHFWDMKERDMWT